MTTAQPQPAALRDAEVIQNVETTLHDLGDWTVGAITAEELIEALAYRGIRLGRAATPPSGQVCVERGDMDRIANMASLVRTGLGPSQTTEHRAIDAILDIVIASLSDGDDHA